MRGYVLFIFLASSLMLSCIGVDKIDDPIVGARIELDTAQVALGIGDTYQSMAVYFDQYGIERDVAIGWSSSAPSIAEVNAQGLITGIGGGQAIVKSSFDDTENQIMVNIVLDETQVANVVIASPGNQTTLQSGEMLTLTSMVKNINGEILDGRTVEWFSANPSTIAVNDQGVLTAVGSGMVDVHAESEGVKSNVIAFASGTGRSGMFMGSGGYKAIGTASLSLDGANNLYLDFSSNFETSFALGSFVYLANSTVGSQVRAGGLEVAEVTTNGAKSYNITAISPSTSLFTYKYVVILCKPATITFGFAELK